MFNVGTGKEKQIAGMVSWLKKNITFCTIKVLEKKPNFEQKSGFFISPLKNQNMAISPPSSQM